MKRSIMDVSLVLQHKYYRLTRTGSALLMRSPYNNSSLLSFLDTMIYEKAERTDGKYFLALHKLHYDEQCQFASHLMDCHQEPLEFIPEGYYYNDIADRVKLALIFDTTKTKVQLAEVMCNAALSYFLGTMEDILDDRCAELSQ